MRVLSLATWTQLPQARVLARSLQEHIPDWRLTVALAGAQDRARSVDGEAFAILAAEEVIEYPAEHLVADLSPPDLDAILAGRLLRWAAENDGAPVVYLAPELWIRGSLEGVAERLEHHAVLMAPRTTAGSLPEDGLQPSNLNLMEEGRISTAFIAINGSAASLSFLEWMDERLLGAFEVGMLDGHGRSRPDERRWARQFLELAPAMFSAGVLDEPGSNLSFWNLHERTLVQDGETLTVGDGAPVSFLDMTGFRPDRPHELAPLASRVRLSRSGPLRALALEYAGELGQAGWQDFDRRREVGRHLPDGLLYDERLCRLHAHALAIGEDFGDIFEAAGSERLIAWAQGPAPRGTAAGVTRYLYAVYRDRPDLPVVYPDLDGADGLGFTGWCWVFGRREMSIPQRFLPPPPPGVDTAPGEDPAVSVRVSGYLDHALGLGAAARGYVNGLRAAGVEVSTHSVELDHLEMPPHVAPGYGREHFEHLLPGPGHAFELIGVNADELPAFVEKAGADFFAGPRIGIWGWEISTVPDRWREALALVDEIWVYSRFMAENIALVSPVPVVTMPPPVSAPGTPVAPLRLGVPDGFLFLFVFDYLSTIQRKNPVGLIEAFKRAFAPGEGPQLLLKTLNAPLRPLAEEEVLWAAEGRPDIHVMDRSLSTVERDGLMAACDCYASLHRAEGFGLTMAEAMAQGKPVIATGYSGNTDFMTVGNSHLVEYRLTHVGPACEIYPAHGEWAEPSTQHAAELMRTVHLHQASARSLGERARADIGRQLSPRQTGTAMRGRLERLSERSALR